MAEKNKSTEYLCRRLELLKEEMLVINAKKQKISYEIDEVRHKIQELLDNVDSAFDIFSPRPRGNDFTKEEIESLMKRQKELEELFEEYDIQYHNVEEDIEMIGKALEEDGISIESGDSTTAASLDNYEETIYGVKILEQQEQERQRIARELHDSSVQVLTNLVHKCEICSRTLEKDPIKAKLELEIMSKSLRETIDEMRSIIYNLRPISFEDTSFNDILDNMVERIQRDTNIDIHLKIEGQNIELPIVVSLTFVRIIQEACSNAIRHSEASNIYIDFQYDYEQLHLVVEDDGVGFNDSKLVDSKNTNTGFGIPMMKERVYLLAGTIDVTSVIGKGTRIDVYVPIA